MATATRTVAVNAAFLQEIKEDNRELRHLLAETGNLLSRPQEVRAPLRKLAEALSNLRDQFAMHFSLEEAFGYFDDAVDVAPRLCEQAESLRNEHEGLFRKICEIEEAAEQLLYGEASTRSDNEVARRFFAFRDEFERHESRENDLIFQALDDDIGVGD